MTSDFASPDYQKVCPENDLPLGKSKRIMVGNIAVAIFHIEQGYFAIEDSCPHQGASLAFGSIDGFCVGCPRHGALFDVRSGEVLSLPSVRGVRKYAVKSEGGNLLVATKPESDKQPELLKL